MKHISTRQLALCAVLTALALGLSTLENLFPVTLLIPLPGVKLGLANIVTVFALYQLGALPALAILTARCLLGGLFAGNASAMLFSLLGGLWKTLDKSAASFREFSELFRIYLAPGHAGGLFLSTQPCTRGTVLTDRPSCLQERYREISGKAGYQFSFLRRSIRPAPRAHTSIPLTHSIS